MAAKEAPEQRAPAHRNRHLLRYDASNRRVWIRGQRLHHGATGAALAATALAGMAAHRRLVREIVPMTLLGGLLMVHDWDDRSRWFERGAQLGQPI